jgi:hypothetical protein
MSLATIEEKREVVMTYRLYCLQMEAVSDIDRDNVKLLVLLEFEITEREFYECFEYEES